MHNMPNKCDVSPEMWGYTNAGYAQALSFFGTPRKLEYSNGWILVRQIPGCTDLDAMGCYPLFSCRDWSQLHMDIERLKSDLVSLSLVADPFGEFEIRHLRQCFRDVFIPFKEHFVVDLGCPIDTFVSNHHRRYAQKSLRNIVVEKCEDPTYYIDEWTELYTMLTKRHQIKGIAAFSKASFARQLQVPGLIAFQAKHNEVTVGMTLWYVDKEIGNYHLAAYSPKGYEVRASFALFWSAIEHFAQEGLRWLNLGAGAGTNRSHNDGLSRFKQGWSTGTRTAYLCGHIFDQARYTAISAEKHANATNYFPAYRYGEFG